MVKIQQAKDLEKIRDDVALKYTSSLLKELFRTYEVDTIEAFGAIYYIQTEADLSNHKTLGLSSPLNECRFEWIEDIGNGYVNGCIVIDNDTAVNLVGKQTIFRKYIAEEKNE